MGMGVAHGFDWMIAPLGSPLSFHVFLFIMLFAVIVVAGWFAVTIGAYLWEDYAQKFLQKNFFRQWDPKYDDVAVTTASVGYAVGACLVVGILYL